MCVCVIVCVSLSPSLLPPSLCVSVAVVHRSTDYIFANNRAWVEERLAQDPDTFKRLAKSQKPRYMYIGCSDSRVPAQNMMVRGRLLCFV